MCALYRRLAGWRFYRNVFTLPTLRMETGVVRTTPHSDDDLLFNAIFFHRVNR